MLVIRHSAEQQRSKGGAAARVAAPLLVINIGRRQDGGVRRLVIDRAARGIKDPL